MEYLLQGARMNGMTPCCAHALDEFPPCPMSSGSLGRDDGSRAPYSLLRSLSNHGERGACEADAP
jgi:hypothetical protein